MTGSSADEPLQPNAYGADDDRNEGWRSSSTSGACIEPLDLQPITEPGFEIIANLNPYGRLGRTYDIPEHLGSREPELERGLPGLREGEHEVRRGVGMGRGERIPPACVHQRDLSFLSKSMAIGPYLFGTVGGHDIPGVTAHGILLGEEFALPGKDTLILSEKQYTFCQTHKKCPFGG